MSTMYPDELGPFEWSRWFRGLSDDEATDVARKILTRMKHDTHCFQNDHVGRLQELSSRLIAAESVVTRQRNALIVIRSKTEDGLRQ